MRSRSFNTDIFPVFYQQSFRDGLVNPMARARWLLCEGAVPVPSGDQPLLLGSVLSAGAVTARVDPQ